ncbi:MerR family transcriptional regulator [Massilia sp. Root418]|uniref:MerR family transcriptional regulator n=1 Tax=Massilia sp. Root418 TaxID=1736532 RepID=UPI0006FE5B7E|nr:MerR family transcriptional regulator [Massilia sp. Root418]KQX01244.1 MerR family transcriptional regulator [Massilia sp. Root418]
MRIGEIASRAGVSRDTVRFYERMGLLSEATQPHLSNNYKEYSPVALRRIELITHAKALGFTLKQIAEVIGVWEQDALAPAKKQLLIREKIREVEKKAQSLSLLRSALTEALSKVESGCTDEDPAPRLRGGAPAGRVTQSA